MLTPAPTIREGSTIAGSPEASKQYRRAVGRAPARRVRGKREMKRMSNLRQAAPLWLGLLVLLLSAGLGGGSAMRPMPAHSRPLADLGAGAYSSAEGPYPVRVAADAVLRDEE